MYWMLVIYHILIIRYETASCGNVIIFPNTVHQCGLCDSVYWVIASAAKHLLHSADHITATLQCAHGRLYTHERALLERALYVQTLSNRNQAKPMPAAVTQAVTLNGFGGTSSTDGMRTVDFSAPVRMHNKLENGKQCSVCFTSTLILLFKLSCNGSGLVCSPLVSNR
jgi:hypothetical protein